MAVREVSQWGTTEQANRAGGFDDRTETNDHPLLHRETQAAIARYVQDALAANRVSTGTATAYAVTAAADAAVAGAAGGPPEHAVFSFRAHVTSGANPTLAISGGPAWAIRLPNGNAPADGQLPIGHVAVVRTDRANARFILLSPLILPSTGVAWGDITGKPAFFSGRYADLQGRPTLFSGAYGDLTGRPTIPVPRGAGTGLTLSGNNLAVSVPTVRLTKAAFNALNPKAANTFYVIVG